MFKQLFTFMLSAMMAACDAPQSDLAYPSDPADLLPMDQVAPPDLPQTMTLTGDPNMYSGRPYTFYIENAPPSRRVWLVRTNGRGGTGLCTPWLSGYCFGITAGTTGYKILDYVDTNRQGRGTLTVTIPTGHDGTRVALQVVGFGPTGSNPLVDTIRDPPVGAGVAPIVEMVAGDIPYPTSCIAGDYECQAEQVCEGVTGTDCIRQDYDCATGSQGSYYPVGTPGGSDFNFAITYDFYTPAGDYGNICCCNEALCASYGIRQDHQSCGTGHWERVAPTAGGSQACAIKEAEHPTYTTPDRRVALCGNTYESYNIDQACAAGWSVCTQTQWNNRYPSGVWPQGTLSSFGVPQTDRISSTWYAGAPAYTPESSWLWSCGSECYDGYNPWNSGKYLWNDARTTIMKGNGSCCNWDSGFSPTSDTSGYAVYCCKN